jgi:capsid protein
MNIKRALSFFPAAIGFGFGSLGRGFQAGLTGQWEGAEHSRFRRRPGLDLSSQDKSLNFGERENLLSEARNLSQTFPLSRYINRKYANHVVGSCRMKWGTGDPEFDKIYSDAWQAWMPMADRSGRHHFKKMTKLATESIIRDGKIFGQKDTRGGFLQIAPIEGDRVSSHGIYNADTPDMVAGMGIDGNGRMKFARVWERTLYGYFQNPQEIPANQLVHAFDSDRFDAVTGVTHYHTVLNTIRDFKETDEAERLASKRHSKLALLVKSIMGGASKPAVNLFAGDNEGGAVDGTTANVQAVNDVADMYMLPGEDAKAHTSERPSDGWRWLMEFQIRQIALGLDLPFGVVWHMSGLGGPATRFEIGQANRVFREFLSDILGPMWIRPIVGAWIVTEIESRRLPFHPNWYKFQIPYPSSITIDMGRDSKAGISENAAGLLSASEWYAEDDKDFEEETEKLAQEAAFRQEMADKYKIPLEQIRIITQQGNPPAADAPDEPTPAPAPQKKAPAKAEIETAIAPEAVLPKKRKYIVKRDAKGRMEELEEIPC